LEQVLGSSPVPEAEPDPIPEEGLTPQPTPELEPTTPPSTGDPVTDLAIAIDDAQRAYQDGQDALAEGDFGAYGEAQDRLAEALERAAVAEAQITGESNPAPIEEGVEDAVPDETVT